MFIKKSQKKSNNKTYTNHMLVESVATAKGPRHRVVCSLGSLEPAPKEEWLQLAHRLQDSLRGQTNFVSGEPEIAVESSPEKKGQAASTLHLETDGIELRHAREAGPVHVGHQMWELTNSCAGLALRKRQFV